MTRNVYKNNKALSQLVGIEPNPGPKKGGARPAAPPAPVSQKRSRRRRAKQPSVGARLGAMVGDAAQKMFKRITGFGDYSINSNSLVTDNSPPIFAKNGRGVIIKHREYLGDITGSVAFNINGYPINPGMPQTFPWLSAVASAYEQFSFKGLVFEFKSTSSNALNSTNTALGAVIMATEYDSKKPAFSSKLQMENYEFATSCKPAESCLHPVECNPAESTLTCLYTRQPSSVISDLRFNDLGQFYIATVGMQASSVIGELWCTYEVELLKPRIDVVPAVNSQVMYVDYGATTSSPISATASLRNYIVSGGIPGISGVTISVPSSGTSRITVNNAGLLGSYLLIDYKMFAPGANVALGCTMSNPSGCSYALVDFFPNHYSSGTTSQNSVTINAGAIVLVTAASFSIDVVVTGTAAITGSGPYSSVTITTLN